MGNQSLSLVRIQLAYIILGTIFLFFGFTACAIAAMRRRTEVRILVWLGIWSGISGISLLARRPAVVAALPRPLQIGVPYVTHAITYLVAVVALLAWSELTIGKVRLFTQAMAILELMIGLAGFGWFVVAGSGDKLVPYNNLLVACALLVLEAVVVVPKLSTRFLVFPNRILAAGTLVFAVRALYTNLSGALRFRSLSLPLLDELVFAGFLFSFAYVAGQKVFANERRLLSIENELDIARQIQASILPASIPEIKNLRIAVSYQPMTAVGGDFYEFIQIDQQRIGFLVADVSGHGVPAALIASMIKVAVQSIVSCAHDPAEVLRRLNRILSGQLRGQFVSAAYLWMDMEIAEGLYSAAGHPPLLCWREGNLKRVESNGLLFGVVTNPDYPVCHIPLRSRDRLVLYTDGAVEPENAAGESFGDAKLEQAIRNGQSLSALEFSTRLRSEIANWQPAHTPQQDDITLIVIDIV